MNAMMTFHHFRFRPGVNTTFRRGDKWHRHFRNPANRVLYITDQAEGNESKGIINVLGTSFKKFHQLTPDEVDAWHSRDWPEGTRPFSRYFAINQAMEGYYPMPKFNTLDMVTVVSFEVIEIHGKTGEALEKMLRGVS